MKLDSNEFKKRLAKLCKENWKAKSILEINGNEFRQLPEHQQKLFLKDMHIDSVTFKTIIGTMGTEHMEEIEK